MGRFVEETVRGFCFASFTSWNKENAFTAAFFLDKFSSFLAESRIVFLLTILYLRHVPHFL